MKLGNSCTTKRILEKEPTVRRVSEVLKCKEHSRNKDMVVLEQEKHREPTSLEV